MWEGLLKDSGGKGVLCKLCALNTRMDQSWPNKVNIVSLLRKELLIAEL